MIFITITNNDPCTVCNVKRSNSILGKNSLDDALRTITEVVLIHRREGIPFGRISEINSIVPMIWIISQHDRGVRSHTP